MSYDFDLTSPTERQKALDALNEQRGELATTMNIVLTHIEPGRLEATMPVEGNRQPYGLLHGGASGVLAETLGSIAAAVHAGPDAIAVGVDLNATHHRAGRGGVVTGVCTPLHEGRRTATYGIQVTDSDGKLICTARLTCQLIATS